MIRFNLIHMYVKVHVIYLSGDRYLSTFSRHSSPVSATAHLAFDVRPEPEALHSVCIWALHLCHEFDYSIRFNQPLLHLRLHLRLRLHLQSSPDIYLRSFLAECAAPHFLEFAFARLLFSSRLHSVPSVVSRVLYSNIIHLFILEIVRENLNASFHPST